MHIANPHKVDSYRGTSWRTGYFFSSVCDEVLLFFAYMDSSHSSSSVRLNTQGGRPHRTTLYDSCYLAPKMVLISPWGMRDVSSSFMPIGTHQDGKWYPIGAASALKPYRKHVSALKKDLSENAATTFGAHGYFMHLLPLLNLCIQIYTLYISILRNCAQLMRLKKLSYA